MDKKQITRDWEKMRKAAEKITLDAIKKYSREERIFCITNGPYGAMFSSIRAGSDAEICDGDEFGWYYQNGEWHKDIEPPQHIADLLDWYAERFGHLGQALCKNGVWV